MCTNRRLKTRGFTLIELIMFIVIVGVALMGILLVFNTTVKSSADPMIRKQMIAVAEALMSEITLHPLTYCDPDDPNVLYANAASVGAGNCTTTAEAVGAEGVETRYDNANPFDNVSDYHAPADAPVKDLLNNTLLSGYTSSVTITEVGGGAGSLAGLPASAVLQIVVTVSHGSQSISLTGYRFRHSPNAAG